MKAINFDSYTQKDHVNNGLYIKACNIYASYMYILFVINYKTCNNVYKWDTMTIKIHTKLANNKS